MNNRNDMWDRSGQGHGRGRGRGGWKKGQNGNYGGGGQWSSSRYGNSNFSGRGGINKRYQSNQYGNRNSGQQWKNKPRDTPGKRLSEVDISVTEYISDHNGFAGVIKNRFVYLYYIIIVFDYLLNLG